MIFKKHSCFAFVLFAACALAGCPKDAAPSSSTPSNKPAAGVNNTVGKATAAARLTGRTRVFSGDGKIEADENPDGVVQVRVTGAVKGIAVISVNDAGAPEGGQQWDTFVADTKMPAGLGGFQTGGETWQLGVWSGAQMMNKEDGSLDLPAGDHALTLYYQTTLDPGAKLRVAVQRADGTLQWSDVFAAL